MSKSVKKDSIKKHLSSDVHLKAIDLNTKAQLGAVWSFRTKKN